MTFFNRQEEVIDLELTAYGKLLFARGQFKPTFYTFLDDDIIYDKQYQTIPYDPISVAGADQEEQNEAEDRIKEIPRVHTQYNWGFKATLWEMAEAQKLLVVHNTNTFSFAGYPLIETDLDTFYHNIPIGDCVPNQNKAPAWEIRAYNEDFEVTSLNLNLTGTYRDTVCLAGDSEGGCGETSSTKNTFYFGDLAIPQLSSSIEIVTSIEDKDTLVPFEKNIILEHKFEDGRILTLKNGYLLLDVAEHNTEFETENFSIEVFEYWDPKTSPNHLKPLRFYNDPSAPKEAKEIYIPPARERAATDLFSEQALSLGGEFVEYYFDLKVDEEIHSSILCDLVDKKKTIFSDKELKCKEAPPSGPLNI